MFLTIYHWGKPTVSHRTWRACKLNHHRTPVEALYHLAIGNACHILYLCFGKRRRNRNLRTSLKVVAVYLIKECSKNLSIFAPASWSSPRQVGPGWNCTFETRGKTHPKVVMYQTYCCKELNSQGKSGEKLANQKKIVVGFSNGFVPLVKNTCNTHK